MARGGKREGAGRPTGSANKLTTELKTTIMEAFEKLGGVKYLVTVGKDNPQTFVNLLARTLPKDIVAEVTIQSHEQQLRELE